MGRKLVYILCDERDRKATIPLRKFLKQNGIDSQIPVFEGDAATVRQAHQDMLAQCDGLMVFYGAGDEAWKRSIDSRPAQVAGLSQREAHTGQLHLSRRARTADKTDLIDLEEPNLINALSAFSDTLLDPFLKQLAGGAP